MPMSAWIVLAAGLVLATQGLWAQSPGAGNGGETWQTTTPPDWQAGPSFTDPYPPEEQPESADEVQTPANRPGESAGKSGTVPPETGSPRTSDPVMRRLDEAYEDTTAEGEREATRNGNAPSMGVALLRAVFALALVLGLFFLFVKGLKMVRSFAPPGTSASAAPARLAVMDRVSLGSRHAVYLLAVRGRMIVVGTAPGSIVPLAVFPGDERGPSSSEGTERAAVAGRSEGSLGPGETARFRGLLSRAIERMENQPENAGTETGGSEENPVDQDIEALREDIERLRRFLEESGRDRSGA